ncbi:MAG: hypothetical protein KC493_13330 [Bacteriovoracaceae bacterium]|nr:hypothetical protein [Bacteriovoracaceae bacterium]
MKAIFLIMLFSFSANAQGLIAARTGIEGEGTNGRSILRLDINSVRVMSSEELRSTPALNRTGSQLDSGSQAILNKFALDLENIQEITLKDGTVIKKAELEEKVYNLVIESN